MERFSIVARLEFVIETGKCHILGYDLYDGEKHLGLFGTAEDAADEIEHILKKEAAPPAPADGPEPPKI